MERSSRITMERDTKDSFFRELIYLYNAHKKYNMQRFHSLGLSTGQPKVLTILLAGEGYVQKDLAERCMVEPATMTTLLRRMEQSGLIYKKATYGTNGKRAMSVFLTDKGRELAQKVEDMARESDELCMSELNEEERVEICNLMRKARHTLEEKLELEESERKRMLWNQITGSIISIFLAIILTACSAAKSPDQPSGSTDTPAITQEVSDPSGQESSNNESGQNGTGNTDSKDDEGQSADSGNSQTDNNSEGGNTVDDKDRQADIDEAIKEETAPTAEISDTIPVKYQSLRVTECGKVEKFEYTTRDYFGDGSEITKPAYIYLPYGYDPEKQYNVLILCHGIGGNEAEWGMTGSTSKVKKIMDNLIYYEDIEPFIVVTPNGRSSSDFANTNSDYNSFYLFGQELRNDLIPYLNENYATYGKGVEDLSTVRDHYAMAGLSMGGMQTINIGMCECLDMFSWFGAFSAAPTSYTSAQIAKKLDEQGDYEINYLYSICGTEDGVAYAAASAATKNLCAATDRVVDGENYMWMQRSGGHDFNIWYLGFYDFAQLAFKMKEEEPLEITNAYKKYDFSNPILTQHFGADPYAMEYDGRLYIYMTADAFEKDSSGKVKENSYSQIKTLFVVSTDDMINFTDHGEIPVAGAKGAAKWAHNSWAPAACWKMIDGKPKFFLYFADNGGGIGVLTSDSPTGPFEDPLGHALISRSIPNCGNVLWLFDPAVLVDDDGTGYLYFGGGVPEGKVADPGTGRVAKLGADMISVDGDVVTLDVPYLFEDSGIHKFNNKYYYTYCTNWSVDAAGTEKYGINSGEIAMMESDSPMGPFTFKEVILKNPGTVFKLYGNNHHCVAKFKDEWYIVYHARTLEKEMRIEKGYRSTHVEKIEIADDGSIGKIKMTYKSRPQLQYVDPYTYNSAVNVTHMGGVEAADSVVADGTATADLDGDAASALADSACGGFMYAKGFDRGDFTEIQGVDFGEGVKAGLTLFARNNGEESAKFSIRIDDPEGAEIARVTIPAGTGDFTAVTKAARNMPEGVHNLFIVCTDGGNADIAVWRFEKE